MPKSVLRRPEYVADERVRVTRVARCRCLPKEKSCLRANERCPNAIRHVRRCLRATFMPDVLHRCRCAPTRLNNWRLPRSRLLVATRPMPCCQTMSCAAHKTAERRASHEYHAYSATSRPASKAFRSEREAPARRPAVRAVHARIKTAREAG